jgi:hypothetical protein
LKLQFAIEFSLNLREKKREKGGNERKEKEEGVLQFETHTHQKKSMPN